MKKRSVVAAFAALAISATTAFAIVTFNPETGGEAGKGDVQIAFNWNNAAMQANYQQITFEYRASATYAFDCEWYTGPDHNRKRHENSKEIAVGVPAAVVGFTAKVNQQFSGWRLDPIGSVGSTLEPTNADCGAEGNEMKSIVPGSVELIGGATAGLFAIHPTHGERQIQ